MTRTKSLPSLLTLALLLASCGAAETSRPTPEADPKLATATASKDTAALLQEAVAAYEREDYVRAREIWKPLAEAGNADAQYKLGVLYIQGRGVEKDYAKAREWFEKAAAQGDVRARYYLSLLDSPFSS